MRLPILLLSLFLFAFSAHAEQINCEDPINQTQLNICSVRDYQTLDAQLNATYNTYRKMLEPKQKEALKQAELAWIKYRDLVCDYEADQYAGGSMSGLVYNSCLKRITTARLVDLKRYLEEAEL